MCKVTKAKQSQASLNTYVPALSRLMSGSSHIQSVLIGVKLWMFIYFLLVCLGKFNQN